MNVTTETATTAAVGVKNGKPAECGATTVRRSASIANLAKAMAAAQAELRNPPKDSVNPHFKSKYADLATVRDTVSPVLSKHKLAVMQFPCEYDDQPALLSLLTHESGEWVETTIKLRGKTDPQGVGSALTYMRRYCLQSIAGVAADEDDDANEASRPQQQRQQAAPPKDNPQERARAAGALAQAKDEADARRILANIAKAIDDGDLGPGDAAELRKIGTETLARFKPAA